jgi:hypothetical protein
MNKIKILLLAVFAFQLQAATNDSRNVKVSWQNPEKFSDIRPSNGSKKAYQKQVIESFDKILGDLGEKLPDGYRLELTITDLDLAGDVNPLYRMGNNDVRVVKDIYFPKMQLNYVLLDPSNQVVDKANDVKIKDMGFMMASGSTIHSRQFSYETEMLEKWFKKDILPKTAAASEHTNQ